MEDSPSRSSWRLAGDPEDSSCDGNESVSASGDESVEAPGARTLGEDHLPLPPPCGTCSVASLGASCDDAATCLQSQIIFVSYFLLL